MRTVENVSQESKQENAAIVQNHVYRRIPDCTEGSRRLVSDKRRTYDRNPSNPTADSARLLNRIPAGSRNGFSETLLLQLEWVGLPRSAPITPIRLDLNGNVGLIYWHGYLLSGS